MSLIVNFQAIVIVHGVLATMNFTIELPVFLNEHRNGLIFSSKYGYLLLNVLDKRLVQHKSLLLVEDFCRTDSAFDNYINVFICMDTYFKNLQVMVYLVLEMMSFETLVQNNAKR